MLKFGVLPCPICNHKTLGQGGYSSDDFHINVSFILYSEIPQNFSRILYRKSLILIFIVMRLIEINGNKFSNINGFYREVENKMTSGLTWKTGKNLDAFNDILGGGFGVHEVDEIFILKWHRSDKSKKRI